MKVRNGKIEFYRFVFYMTVVFFKGNAIQSVKE